MKLNRLFVTQLVLCFCVFTGTLSSQTTEFTYQGRLLDNALPPTASYDFEFSLWDSLVAGTQQGTTQTVTGVAVANGIFTVKLNFGAQFTGAARFLEIHVRPTGPGAYTTLAPRQSLTSSPYSIRSSNSGNADALSSACLLCVTDAQISGLSTTKLNGTVAIANGGTGAGDAASARTNLGLGVLSTVNPTGTANSSTYLRGDNTWASGPVGPPGPPGPTGPAGPVDIVASIDTQFSQDDRSGWTHIEVLPDDACNAGIPLGFNFTGWGLNISTVGINNNGFLIFGPSCPTTGSWNNGVLPSGITTDPFVAFFWDDLLEAGTGEYIEYQTFGTAGGRVFNMYFRNRLLSAACGTDAVNIMLAIHEGSNLVRISYSGMSGCAMMRGSSATFGMQGPGGINAKAFNAGTDSPILDDNANRNMISYLPPKQ